VLVIALMGLAAQPRYPLYQNFMVLPLKATIIPAGSTTIPAPPGGDRKRLGRHWLRSSRQSTRRLGVRGDLERDGNGLVLRVIAWSMKVVFVMICEDCTLRN
jgi:hypothetical protein